MLRRALEVDVEMAALAAAGSEAKAAPPPFSACVLVPAYDAARTLAQVVSELRREVPQAAEGERLIVIDDGSVDGSGRIARELGCTVVAHDRNRGKGAALRTGLATARAMGFDVALTVDADGQHPAASARALLFATPERRALVLGIRDLPGAGAPWKNQVSNRISNFFLSLFSGRSLRDTQCGLRRYPIEETLALGGRATGYAYEAEVILRALDRGLALVETDVLVVYPAEELRVTHFDSVKDPARIVGTVVATLADLARARRARR